MQEFISVYGENFKGGTVIDIGSRDYNGSYRTLFTESIYIGVDIAAGLNVDMLMGSTEWNALQNVDAAISGQTFEHVADRPQLMGSIFNVLKSGAMVCIIVPSEGPQHDYPIWTGNISRDQLSELVTSAGFAVLDLKVSNVPPWNLVRCIARKGDQ